MDRLTEMNESKTAYFYPQCFENCGGVGSGNKCDSCDLVGRACDKLGAYEDLEEQGKLLKLPCVVGDIVYWLPSTEILPMKILYYMVFLEETKIAIFYCGANKTLENFSTVVFDKDIGKSVFLTNESAEAALKEMSE